MNENLIVERIRHYIENQICPIDELADVYNDEVITVDTAIELNRLEQPYDLPELTRHVTDRVYTMLDCDSCELYLNINKTDEVMEITADILIEE